MTKDAHAASTTAPKPTVPKLRSDAQRNRARLLAAARTAFARDGAGASLDDIARAAGVGSGTLYRHFPTREALIEAVFQVEVQKLADAAQQLLQSERPLEALRRWLYKFIQYVANKKLILPAMETVPGGSMRLIEGSRGKVHGSLFLLVNRAVEAGELKRGVDPQDLLRAIVGLFYTTFMPGWEASARRIVDLLLAGAQTD